MPIPPSALTIRNVSKRFGGVDALNDVSIDVAAGEVHALIGVNGSGKSTLIKTLTGYHAPDPGAEMSLWGERVELPVRNHVDHGIAVLHQQDGLIDDLTVCESVGAGVGYGARLGHVSWRREHRRCEELSRTLGIEIDPDAVVRDLSASERALVALLRSVRELQATSKRHLFILDEPTVAFTPTEVAKLTTVIRRVKESGDSIIFVSHKLREVLDLADRISVLRDGRLVATLDRREATTEKMIDLMLGGVSLVPSTDDGTRRAGATSDGRSPGIRLDSLTGRQISDLSLSVRPGEIVGFTGLAGMGQDELPYLLSGDVAPLSGSVHLGDAPISQSVRRNMRRGVALVPGDRAREGLWLDATAGENLTLPVVGGFFKSGVLRTRPERGHAVEMLRRYGVRPLAVHLPAKGFSGGNQQKIVLAKAMQTDPRVLLLHEPTVGVDIGAKSEIYNLVRESARQGAAVLVFGSDYDEMVELCDRVVVLRDGQVVAELTEEELTEAHVAAACNAAPANP